MRLPGVIETILDQQADLERAVRRLDRYNLWILPAGAPQQAPYELLTSPRLEALLRDARRRFDIVLVDTPPCVPLPDCRILERWIDGVLVVVAAHKTPRKMLGEALTLLDPKKVLGVVFNADDRPMSGYYGYYGDYYGAASHKGGGRWWQRFGPRR
jgi:Mrp family chromosome partitioning ATPase